MLQVCMIKVGVFLAQFAVNVRLPALSQPSSFSLRYCLCKRHAAHSFGWINAAPVLTRAQGSETRLEGGARVCFQPLSPDSMLFVDRSLRVLDALIVLTEGLATRARMHPHQGWCEATPYAPLPPLHVSQRCLQPKGADLLKVMLSPWRQPMSNA